MEFRWFLAALAVIAAVISNQPVSGGYAFLKSDNNNYWTFENVVVGISSAVESDGSTSVQQTLMYSMQALLNSTSDAIYEATGHRLSFSSAYVFNSASWLSWTPLKSARRQRRDSPTLATQPNFENADIHIDIPNKAYGDLPYTFQPGFCGEKGDFIHLTENFVNGGADVADYGTPAKLLAREWIKYFFGAYDEMGYSYSTMYPIKYFGPGAQVLENHCSNNGIQWASQSCTGDGSVPGLPSACTYEIDQNNGRNTNVNTSLMSFPISKIANYFCSNDSNHNSDAPNKHNVMCDGKNIMELIYQTLADPAIGPDSAPPLKNNSQVPLTFNLTSLALGVIWDIADASFTDDSATRSFAKFAMYDFPYNAWIALRESVKTNPQSIDWTKFLPLGDTGSPSDRESWVSESFSSLSFSTSSDRDISQAINALNPGNKFSYATQAILVMSDQVYDQSTWDSFCNTAGSNYQIYLISNQHDSVQAFLNSNSCKANTLSKTRGLFLTTPTTDLPVNDEFKTCYKRLQERKLMEGFLAALPNIILPNLYGPPLIYYEGIFFNSTGDNFTIVEPEWQPQCLISNRFYFETCQSDTAGFNSLNCTLNTNVTCKTDRNLKSFATYNSRTLLDYTNPEMSYSCINNIQTLNPLTPTEVTGYGPFAIYAFGEPTNSTAYTKNPQITMYPWVVVNESDGYSMVRFFARVVRGTSPIIGAKVTAEVINVLNKIVTVELNDIGSGNPDVTAQDGIYSAYFTEFGTTGAKVYTVTFTASDDNMAQCITTPYNWISGKDSMTMESTGNFTRVVSAGSFTVQNAVDAFSLIPPGRILDLQVLSADGESASLIFTTPGDDLDRGTVKDVLIKCSTNKNDLSEANFGGSNQGPYVDPQPGGIKQTVKIETDPDDETHYCAVKTCDEFTCSKVSNIISYTILQDGLTGGQIAGISIAVIVVVVIMVVIGIFIYISYKKHKKAKSASTGGNLQSTSSENGESKLKPIEVQSIPMEAYHQPGNGVENESAQRHSRPSSTHNSSFNSLESGSNVKMSTFNNNNSRTSSPRPVPPPKVPSPIEVIETINPPSNQMILNAKPLHAAYDDRPDSTTYVLKNPDVARPVQLITHTATIKDTGDYGSNYKPDIPLYNHLLTKPSMYTSPNIPLPIPPKNYNNHEESFGSSSSSSSSSSAHTGGSKKKTLV